MFNKKIIILTLIIGLFSISAVSANDNVTVGGEVYNAKIIAEDMSEEYDSLGNDILFKIQDFDGNPIEDAEPKVTYDKKLIRAGLDSDHYYSDDLGTYVLDVDPDAGKHNVRIELNTIKYRAEPVFMKVQITKMPVKLTLKKYVTTTKEYAVLKATVNDQYSNKLYEGKVNFKVNGKIYSVNVKNGVATKKIKLSKAKTYIYTAKFIAKNYKSKTASSKLYIKKAKSYYTLKIRNPKIDRTFKVKLSYRKYVQILNAKNKGKFGYASVNTGIKRPMEWGGGFYHVGLSTNDNYFTLFDYDLGDYVFLRESSYLFIKKINLYTANF